MYWRGKRDLNTSTTHGNKEFQIQRKQGESITTPKIIVEYNKPKNRVDKYDQYLLLQIYQMVKENNYLRQLAVINSIIK